MMQPKRAVIGAFNLAMVMVCVGCAARISNTALKPVDDPDAYDVYATLLPNNWMVRVNARTLVLREQTGVYWDCMPSAIGTNSAWQPVADNFRAENASVRTVRPGFALGLPYIVVSKGEIDARMREAPTDPWSRFYRRYPNSGGYLIVSAVGFDTSKTHAMVYLGHYCDLLCGSGGFHLLEKVDGRWRKAKVLGVSGCVWES